jgi:glycosyltransferase involved in cell wall biosynthesis
MHIVFANNFCYFRGGSERVLFDEMEIVERKGHMVSVFSRNHPNTIDCPDRKYFAAYKDIAAARGLSTIRAAAEAIYNRQAKRAFEHMLREKRPDLVHAHNIQGGLTTSILDTAQSLGVPSVLTLHDLKLACPAYLMLSHGKTCEKCKYGAFYHCLTKRCVKESLLGSAVYTIESYWNLWRRKYRIPRFLISPSQFVKNMVMETGYPEDRIIHIPNMVDSEKYDPNPEPGDYVLFVGRLSHEKGIFVLLEAFRGLNIPLRIVGTGPVEDDARHFVEKNGMSHVWFDGYKSGDDLRNAYRECAFTLIPSTWYENCPMSIIEAYAYGKPVIGSRIGGIPELIEDGQSGSLFAPGDAGELRDAVVKLWQDRSRIRSMGNCCRAMAMERFSPQVHYDSLIDVYVRAMHAA